MGKGAIADVETIRERNQNCVVKLPMTDITALDGSPLAPESIRMMDYLKTRAAELTVAEVRQLIGAAAAELEVVVSTVSQEDARLRPIAGKWTIAEVSRPYFPVSSSSRRGTAPCAFRPLPSPSSRI